MNILFLNSMDMSDVTQYDIYNNLISEFLINGHSVCSVFPSERRTNKRTRILESSVYPNYQALRVKTGNITKVNLIEKGVATLLLEYQFKNAVKKYFENIKFNVVMYVTPPITFTSVIKYIKKRDNAKSYLLIKDIFPQNAVDLDMFSKKSLFYKLFRKKEKNFYKISDYIGCMSKSNVEFLIKYNPNLNPNIVHISPNSIRSLEKDIFPHRIIELREKYKIPVSKKVFICGGNLGKPQGIPFLIKCLETNMNKSDRFFIITGKGTEYGLLEEFMRKNQPNNIILFNGIPKEEYEEFVCACDVGLIFLDHRFTIPNIPSRLLSYMQNSMPVIAATDPNTDLGQIILDGEFGWWCESNDVAGFSKIIDAACEENLREKGVNAKRYLEENFTVEQSYKIIMEKIG